MGRLTIYSTHGSGHPAVKRQSPLKARPRPVRLSPRVRVRRNVRHGGG